MPRRGSVRVRVVATLAVLWVAVGSASVCAIRAAEALPRGRYLGKWVDGTLLGSDTLGPWHDTASAPLLAGRAVLDPDRPIRWLLDDSLLTEAPAGCWVELLGGDLMPGRVVGALTGV